MPRIDAKEELMPESEVIVPSHDLQEAKGKLPVRLIGLEVCALTGPCALGVFADPAATAFQPILSSSVATLAFVDCRTHDLAEGVKAPPSH